MCNVDYISYGGFIFSVVMSVILAVESLFSVLFYIDYTRDRGCIVNVGVFIDYTRYRGFIVNIVFFFCVWIILEI